MNRSLAPANRSEDPCAGLHLFLRADASPMAGCGHVMRCLALGEAWVDMGGIATYVGQCGSSSVLEKFRSAGIDCESIDNPPFEEDPLLALTARVVTEGAELPWVVVDGYDFDAAYYRQIRGQGARLVVIDDLANPASCNGDVVLNHNPYADTLAYDCTDRTVLLLGGKFALIRKEFGGQERVQASSSESACRILVTLGGGAAGPVLQDVLAAASTLTTAAELVVVIGPGNPRDDALSRMAMPSRISLRIVHDPGTIADLAGWADIAVCGGGVTMLELVAMGVPAVAVVLAENQRANIAWLHTAGAVVTVERGVEFVKRLAAELAALCVDGQRRERLIDCARGVVNPRGAQRVCDLLAALSRPTRLASLWRCRHAVAEDIWAIRRLSNAASVREQSFACGEISREEHARWFSRTLESADVRFWVAELFGLVIGQIRFVRISPGEAEVHFSVAPAFRGYGIGSTLLRQTWQAAAHDLNVERIVGRVLAGNRASIRMFEGAGFMRVPDSSIGGRVHHVFHRARD